MIQAPGLRLRIIRMKTSPLHSIHSSARRIIPFEGMAYSHSDPLAEIAAAESTVAMMDRSFYDRILVTGAESVDLLHRISTADLSPVAKGVPIPTVFTNEKGRVVDYVWVVPGLKGCILVASPGGADDLIAWIQRFIIMEDVELKDISAETGMVSFIGPQSQSVPAPEIPDGVTFRTEDFHTPVLNVIGSPPLLERFCMTFEGTTMGVAAFDHFRIARGIPLRGGEITERFNPYDIALLHAVSYTKGCYVGQEVIARLDTYQKAPRSLFGIQFGGTTGTIEEKAPVLLAADEIGMITSVSQEVLNGKRIALAVLRKDTPNGASVTANGAAGTVKELPMTLFT